MDRKRRVRIALGILAAFVAFFLVLARLSVLFSMSMCCGPQATSIPQAREKGLLVKVPRLACPVVAWKGVEHRVAEAWIAHRVKVQPRGYFGMRIVPSGDYSLFVRFHEGRPDLPSGVRGEPVFVHGDSLDVFGWYGGLATAAIEPPFPDSICPRVAPFDSVQAIRMRDPEYRARVDSIRRANSRRGS
jgi:hypothetical protein